MHDSSMILLHDSTLEFLLYLTPLKFLRFFISLKGLNLFISFFLELQVLSSIRFKNIQLPCLICMYYLIGTQDSMTISSFFTFKLQLPHKFISKHFWQSQFYFIFICVKIYLRKKVQSHFLQAYLLPRKYLRKRSIFKLNLFMIPSNIKPSFIVDYKTCQVVNI